MNTQQNLELKVNGQAVPTASETVQTAKEKKSHQIKCQTCGGEFTSQDSRTKFCSLTCKNKARNRRQPINGLPLPSSKPVNNVNKASDDQGDRRQVVATPIFKDLSPQMQIAVDLLKQDARQWESRYRDEKDLRKKFQDKFETAKEELQKLQTDVRIKEESKPSGLQGLGESPVILKLAESIGPVLGSLIERWTQPGPSLVGTDGQLDEAGQARLLEINKWIATLPAQTQELIYQIHHELAQAKTLEVLNDSLMRFHNMLKNKTVIMPHVGYGTIN